MLAFFFLRCRLLSSWLNLSFNVALALAFFRTHICAAGNCAGTASMGIIHRPLSGKKLHIHAQICTHTHAYASACICINLLVSVHANDFIEAACVRAYVCVCVRVGGCVCHFWILWGEVHFWILDTRTHRFNMLLEHKFRFSVRGEGIFRMSTD